MELFCQGGGVSSAWSPAPSGQTIMIGVTMVGDLLFNAFSCNGVLAECLAGNLTTTACCTVDSCLVSGLEVIIMGIFECALITTEVQ